MRKNQRGLYPLWTGTKMSCQSDVKVVDWGTTGFADTMVESADVSGNPVYKIGTRTFTITCCDYRQTDRQFQNNYLTGIQFSDGLFTTHELALRAGVTLGYIFQCSSHKSSTTFALLGGSVRAGTERFKRSAGFTNEFRSSKRSWFDI